MPEIEIQKAFYEAVDGAGGADVTAKVKDLVDAGEISIPASNATFGDPIVNHFKRLRVEYTLNGKSMNVVVEEGATLEFFEAEGPAGLPTCKLTLLGNGRLELQAFQPGPYEFQTARGETARIEVESVPLSIEIDGPWTLRFPPEWSAPASVSLDKLISWTDHSDVGVRYFSGTAEYEKEFEIPGELLKIQPGALSRSRPSEVPCGSHAQRPRSRRLVGSHHLPRTLPMSPSPARTRSRSASRTSG